jgi:hypothetical protein
MAEALELMVVDTVDVDVVVTVAEVEVLVLVKTPGQIYCIKSCGSEVAPVYIE